MNLFPIKYSSEMHFPSITFHYFCFLIVLVFISCNSPAEINNATQAAEEKAAKLQSLKIHIKETEKDIQYAVSEKTSLQQELKQNEINAGQVAARIKAIQRDSSEKKKRLAILNQQRSEQEKLLSNERKILAQQIRSAYIGGRNDYLKLLLNQEDPAKVGRMMAFYDYHNRARSHHITNAITKLQTLHDLEKSISEENSVLESLQQEESKRMQEFNRSREMRESIMLRLEGFISEKGEELENLTTQADELEKLLGNLDKNKGSNIHFFEDIPPFHTMKGKMRWPIEGKLIRRFGTTKKGGDLKWEGVLIEAASGTDVKAINNGKVVFADWFRNLGLLIIIEHGDGYMSLYGHNESLLKKQGDWVLTGENIANVGDSGGQNQTGLYFEIRNKGKPVNPGLWCRK